MKLITGFLTVVGAMLSVTTAQAAFVESEYVCEDAYYMEVAFE